MISHCGLIFISFTASDVEYLCMCLFAVYISSAVKCLFTSLAHFSAGFGRGGWEAGLKVLQVFLICSSVWEALSHSISVWCKC